MRPQTGVLIASVAWGMAVIASYYTIPDERFALLHDPLFPLPFWREAAASALFAGGGAALTVLTAWALGAAAAPLHGAWQSRLERVLFRLAIGFSLLAVAGLGLALAGLHTAATIRVLVMAGAAAGAAQLAWTWRSRATGPPHRRTFPMAWPWRDRLVIAIAAGAVAIAAIGALAPEIEYDALWYHLWLPRLWLEAGRPVDLVEEYIALYPLSWELAYGAAMTVGGATAAKLLHWFCLLLIGLTAAMLTRELFPRASAPVAAALAITPPTIVWEATTAYVDLAVAWYVGLATYGVVRYVRTLDRRWLLTAALVMGGALAIKHLALVAFAILGIALTAGVAARSRRLRTTAAAAAIFGAVALALPAPWYVRAYAASGNPVFPDLYAVFGASPPTRWAPETERGLRAFKDRFGPRTATHLLVLPWDMTMHGARYGGTLGPLFLILVPLALLHRRRHAPVVALTAGCVTYLAVWASPLSSFQLRFLVPIVPVLAVLASVGVLHVERAARRAGRIARVATVGVLAALLAANLPPFVTWHERDRVGFEGWLTHVMRTLPLAVVVGAEAPDHYVARQVPSYVAWQFIDRTLPHDALVLTFSGGDHLYSTRRRVWSDAAIASPLTWGAAAGAEPVALQAARGLGITHVLFDRRQLDDGSVGALAIGSERMRTCHMDQLFDDGRFVLYALATTSARCEHN